MAKLFRNFFETSARLLMWVSHELVNHLRPDSIPSIFIIHFYIFSNL